LRIEIGAELTTLIISFGRTMPFVSICLELLEQRSFIFVILFGSVVYWKTLFICVFSNKSLCFCRHNVRNRLVGTNFTRSGETVSRYFNKVFHAIGELHNDFIRPPSLSTPAKILGNSRWDVTLFLCNVGSNCSVCIRAHMLLL
jgi:hypothetical protein